MREILFRGKRIDNGEWIEGSYVKLYGDRIYAFDRFPIYFDVDPDTISEFTGLTDKNGKKIFEGDIVKENDIVHKEEIQIKGKCSTVSFEKGCWVLLSNVTWDFLQTNAKAVEIIGNIHDNPELVEVVE